MKKTFFFLLTIAISIVAMANPVTPDEARQKIAQFMNPRRAGAISKNLEVLNLVITNHYKIQDKTLAPSLYVFNVADGQGYVIASADDRFPARDGLDLFEGRGDDVASAENLDIVPLAVQNGIVHVAGHIDIVP